MLEQAAHAAEQQAPRCSGCASRSPGGQHRRSAATGRTMQARSLEAALSDQRGRWLLDLIEARALLRALARAAGRWDAARVAWRPCERTCAASRGRREAYLEGTHRLIDPETTLARVMPLAARMGITRVAVLTGLDVIGIPVVAAVAAEFPFDRRAPGQGRHACGREGVGGHGGGGDIPRREHRLPICAWPRSRELRHGRGRDPRRLPSVAGANAADDDQRLLWIAAR